MKDIRTIEKPSIEVFVQDAADCDYLSGRVLDYGCGEQPYRYLIERSIFNAYIGFDPAVPDYSDDWRPKGPFDAILCTQVIQYLEYPQDVLREFKQSLRNGGHLVITGPTSWPIVEANDYWRFTPNGAVRLLERCGFSISITSRRGDFAFGNDNRWCLGWGIVARA